MKKLLYGKHSLPYGDAERAAAGPRGPRKDRPWLRRFWTVIGYTVAALIIAVLALVGFVAPLMFIALWYVAARWLKDADHSPWEYSRFFTALLVAWAVDWLTFNLLTALEIEVLHNHRAGGIPSAAVVLGVAAGYICWRTYTFPPPQQATDTDENAFKSPPDYRNPYRNVLGFCLALFVMRTVVSPVMGHYFPTLWKESLQVLDQISSSASESQ